MKSRNITTIIAEGTDGVGKSCLIDELFKIYNYRYMVYHRGEISNLFYAMKYNRPFSATQNGLPFLHVLLTCEKEELKERLRKREKSYERLKEELSKIDDQDKFIEIAQKLSNDYHIIIVDTSKKTIEQVGKEVSEKIDNYIENLKNDDVIKEWNEHYSKGCKKLGLKFSSKDNQPYINNIPFMSELTCHNGVFERFDNREYPDNLIFSMGYDITEKETADITKRIDFAYPINSKINRRPEIFEYYQAFDMNNKTFLTSQYVDLMTPNQRIMPRVFGDNFIACLSHAKATVYCARDLAHLKMQTARLYEAILARQIVFVDKESDPDCDILRQIWGDNQAMISLLYTTPNAICEDYDRIDENTRQFIIDTQLKWYNNLKETIKGGKF